MKSAYQFNKTTDQNNINHYTEPISRHVAKDAHANQSYTKKQKRRHYHRMIRWTGDLKQHQKTSTQRAWKLTSSKCNHERPYRQWCSKWRLAQTQHAQCKHMTNCYNNHILLHLKLSHTIMSDKPSHNEINKSVPNLLKCGFTRLNIHTN